MPTPDTFTHFDLATIAKADAYKLLVSVVVPRPIAWITSRDAAGTLNVAPFSFFNMLASDPPVVGIGFSGASDRDGKDTYNNVRERGEFVVNMVPEALAEEMNTTAINAPRGTNEAELAGLELAPSVKVDIPRLAGSPASLECKLLEFRNFGGSGHICLAQVVYVHVLTEAVTNPERFHFDANKLDLIGRMHGAGGYTRTRDYFNLDRKTWPAK
jgi:flavin reductase (DIM6/NTAB) family NADH-FMN oxidoreductase RutF